MKISLTITLLFLYNITLLKSQNIDYNAHITQFYGSSCWEVTNQEWTWLGYLSDNSNTTETSSGCVTCDGRPNCTKTGTYASRSQSNSPATALRSRMDSWENDYGSRCAYDNGDDCRAQQTCTYDFDKPLEYQFTNINSSDCGDSKFHIRTFYQYRYTTVSLTDATEYTGTSFTTGGDHPFWGSSGSWADVDNDCAASGTIGSSETSSFSTTISCKRQVSFRWRVSSERDYDYLGVYVNGIFVDSISGVTSWSTKTINLGYGNNTIEWRYTKDNSVNSNEDRGFIDSINFADPVLDAGSIAGDHAICIGENPSTLTSTADGGIYSNITNYQWQYSDNNSSWSDINGATGVSYNPSAALNKTRYYRRRLQNSCGLTEYSNTVTVTVNELPDGSLAAPTPICQGSSANLVFNASSGTAPYDVQYTGGAINNINSGANISVSPSATMSYNLLSITDNNGCVQSAPAGAAAVVTVNTNSTAPTIAGVSGKQCPNITTALTASGGVAGTGATIEWHTGPNGTGSLLGSGNTINVTPSTTTTYYARYAGNCNTTNDASEQVEIREYVYVPMGVTTAVGYCTDVDNWHHFYNSNDEIIFSIQGDLSGATATPVVSINNNGSYYQDAINVVGSCADGWAPGEERFELPRSWNVNFTGTPTGAYNIRYYFPANEKTALETAAANHIASNTACNYTYKYANPNGFFWFKNVGTDYIAPAFDLPTHLSGSTGTTNGIHYAEITGVASFSGGSGGVVLTPSVSLPVELTSFKGWNKGSSNTLQWITESELNNDRFELERSADGQNFEHIATIAGAGTTREVKSYLHEDNAPLMGVAYYRLRQIDYDGTTILSNVIAIEVETAQGEQRFFPNPTTGRLVYQFNAEQAETVTIQVHNMLGQVMDIWTYDSHLGINNKVLNWNSYPSATYHITVSNSQGKVLHTTSVIKKAP